MEQEDRSCSDAQILSQETDHKSELSPYWSDRFIVVALNGQAVMLNQTDQ